MTTKRITKDAIFLALICVLGMFSIQFGDNIKVSLQFLIVLIICLMSDSPIDSLIITGLYLLMGLFLPIYAGFRSGVTPTFGYVISFVVVALPIYFMMKIKAIPSVARIIITSVVALLIVYLIGTFFMMWYLKWDFMKTVTVSIVPYIPFDIAKIAIAVLVVKLLPKRISNLD